MLLKIIFYLAIFCWSVFSYNNFNELKRDMEKKVESIAVELENIMKKKCESTEFDCPVKSYNICEGTAKRQCLIHFPTSNSCNGLSKYSMTSGVRVPSATASFDLSQETKFNLCKTAETPMENIFKDLIDQNQRNYAWLNIGFSDGSHRVSPGFKYEKEQSSHSCKDYEPRVRPWFSSTVYSRKKMIILVDNSKRNYEHSIRYQSMKLSLQTLLKTGDIGDYFNVIQFSDVPQCLINPDPQQQPKLVSIGSQLTAYKKITGNDELYYEALANNITRSQSSEVNYKAALEMAVQILGNSKFQNPQYENFILMFAGFQPSNYSLLNIKKDFFDYLSQKQKQLQIKFTFFGFAVDMTEERGKNLLKNLSCSFNGIFFDLQNIKYESMFLDQARGFYEYLSQGNQLVGYRWTNFYQDEFGLGRMTTVVRAAYYTQKNVTRLIGLAGIDVLVSQMTIYKSESQLKYELSTTEKPFKRNISLCALETIRRKNRCYSSQQSHCQYYQFCQPKVKQEVKTIMKDAEDLTHQSCCSFQQKSQVGMIVGATIGSCLGFLLIILLVYCLIFRKPNSSELQQTYIQIFSKFKDFDHTRIRTDSETSLIKE